MKSIDRSAADVFRALGIVAFVLLLLTGMSYCQHARAATIFTDGFEPPPPIIPVDPCAGAAASNLVRVQKTWTQAFSSPNGRYVPSSYPYGLPSPVPIGANKNAYLTVPITPSAGTSVNLSWDAVQNNGQYGVVPRVNNGGMFIGISPCSGDLRPFGFTADQWYRAACRRFSTSGGIVYSTLPGSNASVCRLMPGSTYWITVSPRNPAALDQETCWNDAFAGCDVQASHLGTVQP